MGEGQEQAAVRHAEQRGRYAADFAPIVGDATALEFRPESRPWRVLPQLSIRMRGRNVVAAAAGGLRSAMQEEADYGHGFVLVPVLLALGALAWFALPKTPGLAELAVLLCVFGIAALLCSGRFRGLRPLALAPIIALAGMLLAAVETIRLDTVVLDGPVTTSVRGVVLSREVDDKGRWRYLLEIRETSEPRLRRPPAKVTLLARSRHDRSRLGR